MRPSRDAGRPSCLAMNPENLKASAVRRVKLLAAFDGLGEDTRADFLETAETMAFRAGGVDFERDEVRGIFRQVYAAAGWEDQETRGDKRPL